MDAQEIVITQPKPQVWTPMQMFWGTAFGGYLCGFYLLKDNYMALGYPNLAKKALLAGIISTFLLCTAIIFIPEESIRRYLLALYFIQGCLAGGYLLYEHYKTLFDWNLAKQFLLILPLLVAVLIAIPFYLPEHIIESIPSITYMVIPAALIQGYAQSYQGESIKELREQGTQKNSVKKLIGIVLLSILSNLLLLVPAILIAVMMFP